MSVVMPSMNQAAYIGSSIESVLSQDGPQIELIIADGGSTDGSIETLERYRASHPQLRYFSKSDNGPADAIGKALQLARGTIIGWLNSDDLYTEGALCRAHDALVATSQLALVYGHGHYIDAAGRLLRPYPTLPPSQWREGFQAGCFICQPTVFFKRSVLTVCGGLDATYRASFDYEFWVRVFSAMEGRIALLEDLQAHSRLHEECITERHRGAVALEGLRIGQNHLGSAQPHWLLTYLDEAQNLKIPASQVNAVIEAAREYLSDSVVNKIVKAQSVVNGYVTE